MKRIRIESTTGKSIISIDEKIKNADKYIEAEKVVIITDYTVKKYYENLFPYSDVIAIEGKEENKNLDTIRYIYNKFMELDIDRSSFVLGIGGGVVCDITGFAASTFMRGIRFGFIPSTLLAQIDAAIGGKNGVNLDDHKNMIGVINQPEFVLCDTALLKSLPKEEILCGLAEAVKAGAIRSESLFSYIETNYKKAVDLDYDVLNYIIYESVLIKSTIVNAESKDLGERRLLNFGHTFGHAVELLSRIRHGEAISIGMVISALLSVKRGILSDSDFYRIKKLLSGLNLLSERSFKFDMEKVIDALRMDKKRVGNQIDFILLESIGNAIRERVYIDELSSAVLSLDFY